MAGRQAQRKLAAVLGTSTLALILATVGAPSTAAAATVTFMPEVSSGALGGLGSVNATVGLTGTEYGGSPAPITEVVLRLPVGTKLAAGDHATCSKQTLEEVGASGCPVGSAAGPVGKVLSIVSFGTERVPEEATLESFYSPEGGLSFFIQGRSPVTVEVAASASIAGNVITLAMPLIMSVPGARDVSITELGFRLGETDAEEESSHLQSGLTLPAECAAGKFSWSAAVTVALNGETSTPETDETPAETGCPGTEEPVRRRHEEEASVRKRAEEEAAARKRAEEEAAATAANIPSSGVLSSVAGALPSPELAVSGDLTPVSGSVLVKLPGTATFVALTMLREIPFGTVIDATHGRVSITTAGPHGGTQTGEFFEGEFVLTQGRNGLVVATLTGGYFSVCPTARERSHVARASSRYASGKHVVRKLWANAHGSFSTKGNYAAGAVEGTEWLTEDLCEGTLIRVTRDRVVVTNLVNHRHVTVKAGHRYLAKAP